MAQELLMTSRRLVVLAISVPIVAFAVIGGFMGRSAAAQGGEGFRALRIFEDVVTLILNNYVEEVDVDKVMHGAMHGLADGLDPDSSYLDAEQAKLAEKGVPATAAGPGLEITRQYYLRVIAAREGSPAAKAGLRPGDYLRAIDGQSTRDISVFEGQHLLRGAPGSKVKLTVLRGNAAEPRDVEVIREVPPALPVKGRVARPGVGVLRIAEFTRQTAAQARSEIAALAKAGATRLVIDLRGASFGDLELGLDTARLFVSSGTLAYRQERNKDKDAITAVDGDGAIVLPAVVLVDAGSSGPAELFAVALQGNKRATIVGERTVGRAARQRLVKLPQGDALMLTHLLYLAPGGGAVHEKGLVPDVAVETPDVEFGETPAPGDPALDKAIEALTAAPAKAAA
jgi:carboxyl-terminal processing protease